MHQLLPLWTTAQMVIHYMLNHSWNILCHSRFRVQHTTSITRNIWNKYKRTVTPNNIFIVLFNLRFDYILVIIRTDWCKITIVSIYIVKKLSLMSLKYDQFFQGFSAVIKVWLSSAYSKGLFLQKQRPVV